jgi:hypothetical protein
VEKGYARFRMRALLRRAAPRVAALALLALAVALLAGTFVHTDDGCVVERHCLACRFTLHTSDVTATIATGLPSLYLSEDVRALPAERSVPGQVSVLASRGPPAA